MEIERNLTIAEMAMTFGVSHRSLRFYEQRGLLQPLRLGTVRAYRPSDSIRLQLIMKGKRLGFSLEEIARLILSRETSRADDVVPDATAHLSRDQIATKLAALEAERHRLEAAIAELRQALERPAAVRELELA